MTLRMTEVAAAGPVLRQVGPIPEAGGGGYGGRVGVGYGGRGGG